MKENTSKGHQEDTECGDGVSSLSSESAHGVGKCQYLEAHFRLVSGRTFCVTAQHANPGSCLPRPEGEARDTCGHGLWHEAGPEARGPGSAL